MHRCFRMTSALAAWIALTGGLALAAGTGPQAPPAALTIHIKNFMFVPQRASIHAGDRVTFVNDDDEAHTVTSTDKTFDSEGLDSGNRWQHVFLKAGTVTYFCELHPYMKATLTVLPGVSALQTGAAQ